MIYHNIIYAYSVCSSPIKMPRTSPVMQLFLAFLVRMRRLLAAVASPGVMTKGTTNETRTSDVVNPASWS